MQKPIFLLLSFSLIVFSAPAFAIDTDNDGLDDSVEANIGTDPANPDTDNDTYPDGYEVSLGGDPLKPRYTFESEYDKFCVIDGNRVNCFRQDIYSEDRPLYGPSVKVFSDLRDYSMGENHRCAIDGAEVLCWSSGSDLTVPSGIINPVKVEAGYFDSCALHDAGVICWTRDGVVDDIVPALNNPYDIAVGLGKCALDEDGLKCWGYRGGVYEYPGAGLHGLSVPGRGESVCFINEDSELLCRGQVVGEPGIFSSDLGRKYDFTAIESLSNVDSVHWGGNIFCAKNENEVACASPLNRAMPQVFPAYTNPRQFLALYENTCFLADQGLVCDESIASLTYNAISNLIDSDFDGVPDDYESANNMDRLDPSDAASDIDNDQLSALEEYQAGTRPDEFDSDDDGLGDGYELKIFLSNPLKADADNDSVNDLIESKYGLDPYKRDSDGDGIYDLEEIITGAVQLVDPADQDRDQDGVLIVDEIARNQDPFGDPDKDGDGLTETQEWLLAGNDNSTDTDNDGLSDDVEAAIGSPLNLHRLQLVGQEAYHQCLLDDTGVSCWGLDDKGQSTVPLLDDPWQVVVGAAHSCALDGGKIICWGDNSLGQLDKPLGSNYIQLVSMNYQICALNVERELSCWGQTKAPEGGYEVPTIPELGAIKNLFVAGETICAIDELGDHCWGGAVVKLYDVLISKSDGNYGDEPYMSSKGFVLGSENRFCFKSVDSRCAGYFHNNVLVDYRSENTKKTDEALGLFLNLGDNYEYTKIFDLGSFLDDALATFTMEDKFCRVTTTDFRCIDYREESIIYEYCSYLCTGYVDRTIFIEDLSSFSIVNAFTLTDSCALSFSDLTCTSTEKNKSIILDLDQDGVPDHSDAFPYNTSEWLDTDGDGVGDNADAFPNDAKEAVDSDGDGIGDNADVYPKSAQASSLKIYDGGGSLPMGLFLILSGMLLYRMRSTA